MISLQGHLRLIALDTSKVDKALEEILGTPGWEQKVKDWFKEHRKASGFKGLAIPFATAIMLLSQATGAQTAEELISKIKHGEVSVERQDVSQKMVDKMEQMIPYPLKPYQIYALQVGKLQVGPLKIELTLNELNKRINDEIKDGLRKDVVPKIKKDMEFSKLSLDTLQDLVTKATIQKIDNPKFKDGKDALVSYLKSHDKDMSFVHNIIRKSIKENLNQI